VVTTEGSDWATNCPEYKVTAVQVRARARAPLSNEEFTIPAIPVADDVVASRRGDDSAIRRDLVRMSNQIAANFAYRAPDEAAAEVANHIKKFWPPSMRSELLNNTDVSALDPITVEAIRLLSSPAPT
jgi:formate dehydrogenase subunit delta